MTCSRSNSAVASLYLSVAQTFGTWPDLTSATFVEINSGSGSAAVFMQAA